MNTTFWTSLIALVWLPLLSNAALGNGASPCDTTPCLNGATCYVPSGKATFFCTCSPNYTGTVCDQKITDSTDSLSDGFCTQAVYQGQFLYMRNSRNRSWMCGAISTYSCNCYSYLEMLL
ncbi:fibropellin-3-like isoform X1 [Mytilus edulis]|uniref:fibropellin-3-like isoform X1 n=1 Tax=Mytilus edulis TaxID=6550 RepID=UPI0039EEF1F1